VVQLNVPFLASLGGLALAVAGVGLVYVAARRPWQRLARRRLAIAGSVLILAGFAIVLLPYVDDQGVLGLAASAVGTSMPVVGWTLVAFGVTFILWGLFADRSRGRRRCPRCWYSMEGIESAACPECGHDAGRQRRLYRTRRHWRMAAAGVACIGAGYVATLWLDMQRFGAGAVLPSPLVLGLLEVRGWPRPASYSPPDLATSFLRRMYMAPRWVQEVARRRMARYWTIDYRPVWPAGVPIAVRPADLYWYASAGRMGTNIEARLVDQVDAPGPWVRFKEELFTFGQPTWSDGYAELGPLPAGRQDMRVEFRILAQERSGAEAGGEPLWSTVVRFPIQIVPTIGEVLTPVADPRLDEEIAAGFVASPQPPAPQPPFVEIRDSRGWRAFGFELIRVAQPDVAIALKVEFLREGRVIATSRAWDSQSSPMGSLRGGVNGFSPMLVINGDEKALRDFDLKSGRWSVRITPDPELALRNLRDLERGKYWSGMVTLPKP
jgi:hypothetical protein